MHRKAVQARRNQDGLETVELAIVLPVFLLLLFAVIDFGRLMFIQTTLQHAVREGGRFGVTGERIEDPGQPGVMLTRSDSIRHIVIDAAVGVNLDSANISISSLNGGPGSAGGPGDTMTISLTYRFEPVTPIIGQFFDDGGYDFTASTSFRNEPFPPSAGP